MKKFSSYLLASLVALLSLTANLSRAESPTEADKKKSTAEIGQLFKDYARLMNEKDTEAIATKIYRVPSMYHLANGDHIAFTDSASLALTWKRYIEGIEAKQGPVKLDITDVAPCFLNSNTAVVTTTSIRTVLKDNSTAVSGWLYLLNRKNGEWKISEISARDLESPLVCK